MSEKNEEVKTDMVISKELLRESVVVFGRIAGIKASLSHLTVDMGEAHHEAGLLWDKICLQLGIDRKTRYSLDKETGEVNDV